MRVVIGRIGRPHGIRGEVTVETRTDEPDERFAPGAVLLVDGPVQQLVVDRMHWHSGRLLVTFEGVVDRNDAEALRGLILEVERPDDATPELIFGSLSSKTSAIRWRKCYLRIMCPLT